MKRRIFGLENEYGLTCTLNGQRRLSPDNVARYLFEKVIPGARNANVFLENGAVARHADIVRVSGYCGKKSSLVLVGCRFREELTLAECDLLGVAHDAAA